MSQRLKYSLIMFVAGSFYGIVVPIVSTAHGLGYSSPQLMVTQYLVSSAMLALVVLLFYKKHWQSIVLKDVAKLLGVGVIASGVSFCYFVALQTLPPATALTLLFQFVWIGVVFQIIRERKAPKLFTIISVVLVMIGAVFATGLTDSRDALTNLDPVGVMFGLASALFYAIFLMLSGG
jgi:threonine/homoserine efflux transporter RhtA